MLRAAGDLAALMARPKRDALQKRPGRDKEGGSAGDVVPAVTSGGPASAAATTVAEVLRSGEVPKGEALKGSEPRGRKHGNRGR